MSATTSPGDRTGVQEAAGPPAPGPDAAPVPTLAAGKAVVARLVEEVVNGGRLELVDELYTPAMARAARRWIAPFREAFPDVHMQTVQLVAEGTTVVGRFRCSGTHLGPWRGHAPTGRRFEAVDEVYFFDIADGRISGAWGLEDTRSRLRQLRLPE